MKRALWRLWRLSSLAMSLLVACGSSSDDTGAPTDTNTDAGPTATPDASSPPTPIDAGAPLPPDGGPPPTPLELHFAFIHGVDGSENDLADLETAIRDRVEARRPAFEAANHVQLSVSSVRFNLYKDKDGSSFGTDDGSQDDVARHWRSQLATKLADAFPNGEKNIILVGHSTGGRVAMEIAADVGGSTNTLGVANWGFTKRIAGVVSVHGMLDALKNYATIGDVVPFSLGCKAVQSSGWCGYAANVSGLPAADWVATNRHSLLLTSVVTDDRCGKSPWKEPSDQTLPTRAQGTPAGVGLHVLSDRDGVYRPSHGIPYGEFCHSDITRSGSSRHVEAVQNATARIETWLFDEEPRVVNTTSESQTYDTPTLDNLATSDPYTFAPGCPLGTFSGGLDVVGNCHHPGYYDGDDHAMYPEQLIYTFDGRCGGTVRWKNIHDHKHSGTMWFKAYAFDKRGGVLATLK